MRKSTAVTLVLSGALMAGCGDSPGNYQSNVSSSADAAGDQLLYEQFGTNAITNNTYVAGRGYWHAPFYNWYPFPYNYYRPGYGYYRGGIFGPSPHESVVTSSSPLRSGGGNSSSSGFHSSGSSSSSSHSSISRGGFGGSAHGGSSS